MANIKVAGIDQGTTSTKVMTLDDSGKYKVTFQKEHRQIKPNAGWVEHDPEEIYKNICLAIESAGSVDAIGISHQGETIVAWDARTKEALYNMIVWQDLRTEKEIQKLKDNGFEAIVKEKTGFPIDCYFSASKMSWLIKNVPSVQEALKKNCLRIGTSESFFIDRLTGVYSTDYCSAARTSLFNVHNLEWDKELCEIFEVPIEILPPVKSNLGNFGAYKINGQNIPVTASIVDQFAGIYGHGCREVGDSKVTFGTGAFMQVLTGNKFLEDNLSGLLSTLCWKFGDEDPAFGLDGGVYNVGSAIEWVKGLGLFTSYEELNSFEKKSAIERDLIFVPALSGLACPYWDRTASGTWTGLSLDTAKEDMLQSVLEGIAFRVANNFEAMSNLLKIKNRISIDGGLSNNPYFAQFFANITGKEVVISENKELTSFGIALLARKGLGLEEPENLSIQNKIFKPQIINKKILTEKFERTVEKARETRTV